MRGTLLAALLLALPLAGASQPTPPWVFDGSSVDGTGAVGDPVVVTVRVKANTDLDATILFRAPDWVQVDGGPWHAQAAGGETVDHAWTIVPTQEGFWAAVAHSEPGGFGSSCACAAGYASGAPEAIVGTSPESSVPVPILDRTLTATPREDGTVLLERAVIPVSSWLAHAEVHAWVTPGSTYLCHACAVLVPDPQHETRAPGSGIVHLSAALPLAEGEAYTLWDEVLVRFDAPADSPLSPMTTIATGCENRRWGTVESWGCDTPSEEWSHMMSPREKLENAIPAGGALVALAAVALALAALSMAYRPPRGKRR